MAYTTINKSSLHMNAKLWTGTGSNGNAISGIGFAPDLVWVKNRSGTYDHVLFDRVRGDNKHVESNNNSAEENESNTLAFGSDGYSVGTNTLNNSGSNIVGWNWKANGTGSANTDGSINTTYTSVNTTAGFSISKYTGTGANATVGHGLGAVPAMMIHKNLGATQAWTVYHHKNTSAPETDHLYLNLNQATEDGAIQYNDTAPTSSVFSVGSSNETNQSGNEMIAYCFAEKTGYSKFGSYTGNGNADGTFIYTGFKPAWFMLKRTDGANSWQIFDNKRDTGNALDNALEANDSAAEATGTDRLDFLSQGVKLRTNGAAQNASGGTYIYMCFGQSIVGSNNVPCTAR